MFRQPKKCIVIWKWQVMYTVLMCNIKILAFPLLLFMLMPNTFITLIRDCITLHAWVFAVMMYSQILSFIVSSLPKKKIFFAMTTSSQIAISVRPGVYVRHGVSLRYNLWKRHPSDKYRWRSLHEGHTSTAIVLSIPLQRDLSYYCHSPYRVWDIKLLC